MWHRMNWGHMSNFIIALDGEIAELEESLARDPRYIKLQEVKRLRALYSATESVVEAGVGSPVLPPSADWGQRAVQPRDKPRQVLSGVSLEAVNATREYLAAQSKPIMTRDLLVYLERNGIKFGGASAQATLASILSRTPEFESKGGRVGWVLKSVGPTGGETVSPEVPPVAMFPPSSSVEPVAGGGT